MPTAEAGMDRDDIAFFRLGEADIPEVLALERLCFRTPWNERQFRLAFDQKLFHVFGFRESGRLVAYLACYHTQEEMEILNLAVTPERRRRGLGRRLLGLVLQIGQKMGMEKVHLEVRRGNLAAQRLYAGFGFRQVGLRKAYYPDTGEDALVLGLDVTRPDAPNFPTASGGGHKE